MAILVKNNTYCSISIYSNQTILHHNQITNDEDNNKH
jgi:hypothetical protein